MLDKTLTWNASYHFSMRVSWILNCCVLISSLIFTKILIYHISAPSFRGPFITALGRIWCPEHFICVNANCKRPLADIGFVEEKGDLYCEYCFEQYLAPNCSKCVKKIKVRLVFELYDLLYNINVFVPFRKG